MSSNVRQRNTKKTKMLEQAMEKGNSRPIQILGYKITGLSNGQEFILLAGLHVVCAVAFAAFQEKCFQVPGFKSQKQLLTVLTPLIYCLCALMERILTGDTKQKAKTTLYLQLSCLTFLGMYMTNASLAYLSYPSRIVFKSGKPIPTMGFEWLYVGRLFSQIEITSVMVLTLGIITFAMGEASGKKGGNSSSAGFIFITLGVLFDTLTSNFEKKKLFSGPTPASHTEVMFFASLFGFMLAIGTFALSPESADTPKYITEHPEILKYIGISAVGGYFSVSFVLLLIKHFGPTFAECVKGGRKVLSIVLSFLLFAMPDKHFTTYHCLGLMFFVGSLALTVFGKHQKSKSKQGLPNGGYVKIPKSEEGVDTNNNMSK